MKPILLPLFLVLACRAISANTDRVEFVPAWAKSVVWYQIFPERFRNGDPTNDPRAADLVGADPVDPPKAWQIHPWGSDWYELQPYEKQNGEAEPWKHLQRRRYGGDLRGIIDRLPYLKELGVTALYLNPVFDSPSLHKYDGASYHHIDPNFGPDPAGDRALMAKENPLDPATWVWTKADEQALWLIDEAHAAGMRIIFDGVFNHMGRNSFAFRDLVKNQQASPYRDWFTVKSWDDPAKGTKFDYEGWFGAKSLPELREDANGIVAGPRDYIFAATRRWMNPKGRGPAHGIDGWRLDVAFCIAHPFWKDWRRLVRSLNPEAYLTAEVNDVPAKTAPYLQGDEFDSDMNYNWGFTCTEFFFNPPPTRLRPSEFDRKLRELREAYPAGVAEVQMNLIDSHDTNRVGSLIVNRGIGSYRDWNTYFDLSKAAGNPVYSPRRPDDADIALQKFFVIFQLTYLGAPMIYYGDEVGMWGANDPDCRKPMIWDDLTYADEVFAADMRTRHAPDQVAIRSGLLAHYKLMLAIRSWHPALQHGSYRTLMTDDTRGLFVFERTAGNDRVIVALNNSDKEIVCELGDVLAKSFFDELTSQQHRVTDGILHLTIPAKGAVVLSTGP